MQRDLPVYVQQKGADTWLLSLRVQPGAKKNECLGILQQQLRVRLTAPAVDNKANKALIIFLAKQLKLRQSQLEIIAGETSRQKKIAITAQTMPNWSCLTD